MSSPRVILPVLLVLLVLAAGCFQRITLVAYVHNETERHASGEPLILAMNGDATLSNVSRTFRLDAGATVELNDLVRGRPKDVTLVVRVILDNGTTVEVQRESWSHNQGPNYVPISLRKSNVEAGFGFID